jgi:hypothetical protein
MKVEQEQAGYVRSGGIMQVLTSARNADGDYLTVADGFKFNETVERWCGEHCKHDWDVFTADSWHAWHYAYFADSAEAAAFAREFRGRRDRHPTKKEAALVAKACSIS